MTGVYGIACTYLYYMQSIQPLDYNNRTFQSDLPYHISMIVDDGWYYSFTAFAYQLLYLLAGKGTILIAIFLGLLTVGSVIATEMILRKILKAEDENGNVAFSRAFCLGAALLLQFVMPFFLPYAGQYRYVSYQAGNLWHNSTYLCMRFFALFAFYLYLELAEEYKTRLDVKKLVAFSALLILCTGVKPSFLTVFAPIMALKLLWDLFHKVPFKNIFIFGLTVIPACLVVLWQNVVLFGDDTGNGVTFSPWYTFSLHADRPKWAALCSLAFPLAVLGGTVVLVLLQRLFSKEVTFTVRGIFGEKLGKIYVFLWGVTLVGLALALCLVESGSRNRDGNFLWGYSIGIFLIQMVSFLLYMIQIRNLRKNVTKQAVFRTVVRVMFLGEGLVLLYQTYCGIYFWLRLLCGETYFMQI